MKINIYILVCLIIGAQTSTIAQNSSIPIEETQIQPAQSVQPPRKSRNNNQNEVYRLSKLARNAESANKFERALGLWKQAHEINPGYQSAYSGVKRCLLGLKKPDEALQFVNSMIELSLTGKTSLDPAKIAADKIEVIFAFGNDSLAWVEIENLLAEFKGNQKLYYNLSNVLAAQRLTEEPIEMLLRGRRECGNKFLFAKNLARWHENRMNWESATQEYLLYLEESPQRLNQVVGSLGDIADKLEIDSTIARTVNKWIDREKGDFKLLLRKLSALLHFRAKRYDLAFVQYRTLEESNRGQGKELLEFARLVGKEGEHQLAWDAYNEILLTNPGSTLKSSVNLGRGFSAEALGEIDSAYAIYNAVLEPGISVKTAFEVYQRLGDIEFRQYKSAEKGRIYYQKALDILGKARMPVSRIDSIRVNIILTHEYEGNLEETEKLLTNLLKRNRNSRKNLSGARYELVRLLFRTGKINETEENIEIFLTTLPNSPEANNVLELKALFFDLKDFPEVLQQLGKADLAVFRDDLTSAREILKNMLSNKQPQIQEEVLWRLYSLEKPQNNSTIMLEVLNQVVDIENGLRKDKALFLIGGIYLEILGNEENALSYYERILIEFPESPFAFKTRRIIRDLTSSPL